ncbi:hypothetical protein [Thiothrix lacustris]|uniref:hypothetical protein n=1 Tax=Thiothrix lacustris TaxID=525917 RepID=UPI0027E55699|nr:hypothetical protein [Thiothrix lacustris]WMP17493.1 hypothetical protein RCS87_19250 [Thiothrix lacustris]
MPPFSVATSHHQHSANNSCDMKFTAARYCCALRRHDLHVTSVLGVAADDRTHSVYQRHTSDIRQGVPAARLTTVVCDSTSIKGWAFSYYTSMYDVSSARRTIASQSNADTPEPHVICSLQ